MAGRVRYQCATRPADLLCTCLPTASATNLCRLFVALASANTAGITFRRCARKAEEKVSKGAVSGEVSAPRLVVGQRVVEANADV
jgi:hypothetical protein